MDAGRFRDYLIRRIKYVIKIKYVTIDNKIFAMHYRLSATIFLIFSALIMINQFFGKPIACIKSIAVDARIEQKVIENYCWIEGTFILPRAIIESMRNEVRLAIDPFLENRMAYPHPNIRNYAGDLTDPVNRPPDEILETTYYQWVPIVLFFQSMSFIVTHWLWKGWEGGVQKRLVNNLFKTVYKKADVLKHQNALIETLVLNRGMYNAYAFRYFICEVLNAVHVFIQFAFINWFLGGNYWTYGLDAAAGFNPHSMEKVFPTMTKCRFHKYGPSGDVQKYDNLCILPINIINEKIYLIIWFWLWFLAFWSIIAVAYKIIMIGFPGSRIFLLHMFNRMVPPRSFQIVLDSVSYGDWFLLYLLSKNLDPFHYRDVMMQLANRLEEDRSGSLNKKMSLLDEEVPQPPSETGEPETAM